MCNQCVRALSVISEGMNQYLMETFEVAIRRDLSFGRIEECCGFGGYGVYY